MIYLFYGDNEDQARTKATGLVETLLKKRPDASFFKLDSENWAEALFDSYLGGQGLFVQKYIIQINGLIENKETRDYLEERIKVMKEADHIFIVLEKALPAALLKKVEKHAEKVQHFDLVEPIVKKKEFNFFSLTDALGARDRKKLWVLYRQAVDAGGVAEEVHGILFWQVKSMILSLISADAKAAGLNPFVYSKSKVAAKNFKLEELKKMSGELVKMYHQAHRGVLNFEEGLEAWVLGI